MLALILLTPSAQSKPANEFKAFEAKGITNNSWQIYASNGGASRCKTNDCLCKVLPRKKATGKLGVKKVDRRLSVFFTKDSSRVKDSEVKSIKSFLAAFPTAIFTIIGYTDGCGSTSHNAILAEKRVKTVKKLLRADKAIFSTSSIFKPEVTNSCDPTARRVDVVAHTKNRVTTMLDKIPADVYLIDASGSMWQSWRRWTDVVAASFKPGSKVYLSKTIDCTNNQELSKVKPSGGTEIWYSYWRVLDFMKEGETLVIISDFRSDIPLTRRESATIELKVAKKKIRVIAIQL